MPWIDLDEWEGMDLAEKGKARTEPYAKKGKSRPRFYADETFPTQAISLLRKRGFDVLAGWAFGWRGLFRRNQLAFARKFDRIFLTCNEEYLDELRCPTTDTPTVMVFGFGMGGVDEILSAFKCLDHMVSTPRFYDNWCKIHAKPEEWTEHVSAAYGATSSRRLRWQEGRLQTWAEE